MFNGILEYSNGHYVSHIRRSNGQWEMHNDLIKNILNYNFQQKQKVSPHLIIYTKS
jgi:ubiquitin C-terminal hydrolase